MRFLLPKPHTVIGLLIGVALLFAAEIFGFKDVQVATSAARIVGAIVIINELIAASPFGLLKLVPMRAHLAVDYLIGAVLALSPWLCGFSNTTVNHWLPHLIVGILIVGYALMTHHSDNSKQAVA